MGAPATPAASRACRGRDAALVVLGLAVLAAGWGTLFAAAVALALAWVFRGRGLGMAALFALAVTLAAWATSGRGHGPAPRSVGAAPAAARPAGA